MSVSDRLDDDLLERAEELAALDGLLDRSRASEGALVLVEGPAGIGKTSLLGAAAEGAAERGMTVLRGRGDELVVDSAFAAVRELLWAEIRGARGVLDGAARLAAPVFAFEAADGVDRDRAGTVLYGLYWLVAGLADRAPVAILVDDAHWLDAASVRFVVYLGRRIASLPVLLVVALRPGEGASAEQLGPALESCAASVMRLEPLSEEGSAAIVRHRLGAHASDELCLSCHQATGGIPFYLRELAAALAATPGPLTLGSAERVRALGVGTIGRSVLWRVAALGSDCVRLTQSIAVLGPGSALRHAARLADLERDRAELAADRLRAADVLVDEPGLSFVHPIVSEALAAELRDSRRSALHREAARLLLAEGAPADRVAAHLLSAEPYGEAWVVTALQAAGREALAQGAPEAAVAYLRRALAEPPVAAARREVLLDLGRAETYLPIADDFPALREALEGTEDARQRAEIALELSAGLLGAGRYGAAAELLEGVLARAQAIDPAMAVRIEGHLIGGGVADLRRASRTLARAAPHFARAARGEIGDPVMLAALAMSGAAAGRPARETARLARRALDDEHVWDTWPASGAATIALTFSDALADAARAQDVAIAEAQRRGSAPMFLQTSVFRSCTALRAGDLHTAEDDGRRALDVAHEPEARLFALQWLPAILLERGRAREAAGLLEPLELTEAALGTWSGVIVLTARGTVRIALGAVERGLADLLDADRRMDEACLQLGVLADWAHAAVRALATLERPDEARRVAERELAAARAAGTIRRLGMALALAGTLDPGEERLREAVTLLGRSPARLEHARALVDLGAWLAAHGERRRAREPLSEALDRAHRLGAVALADRARAELVATGARPRRRARRGREALTPAELRTARMAAAGRTNREIAQSLFVSARTVEAQLHQAYAKLGISARGELATALSAAQPNLK
jgi:DNA-binding CsgD family transcriptional regulator